MELKHEKYQKMTKDFYQVRAPNKKIALEKAKKEFPNAKKIEIKVKFAPRSGWDGKYAVIIYRIR